MKLRTIQRTEDKSLPIFASEACQDVLSSYTGFYEQVGFQPPWVAYFVEGAGQIVGTCAFVGAPVNGEVEIAYFTFPDFEGRGIASFACKALVELARQELDSVVVLAKTAPEHNASTRILEKNGFVFQGVVQDHEIGDAWLWKHSGSASPTP